MFKSLSILSAGIITTTSLVNLPVQSKDQSLIKVNNKLLTNSKSIYTHHKKIH